MTGVHFYNPTSFRASASFANSAIDKASPRMDGLISAISRAFSSLALVSSAFPK